MKPPYDARSLGVLLAQHQNVFHALGQRAEADPSVELFESSTVTAESGQIASRPRLIQDTGYKWEHEKKYVVYPTQRLYLALVSKDPDVSRIHCS